MTARKPRKPKAQKSEYPTLPGQLGYLNSYYCPYAESICFQRMTRICGKTGKTAITSMCPVISIIAVNAERFWIWTNGSEKKNQRQQVKN